MADGTVLDQPLDLEILNCVDAGRPVSKQEQNGTGSSKRLLRLQLAAADASQCGAFEYQPLGEIAASCLQPGARVRIDRDTRLVGGMLLLTPGRTDFLGGGQAMERPPATATPVADDAAPQFTPLPKSDSSNARAKASFVAPGDTSSQADTAAPPPSGPAAHPASAPATPPPMSSSQPAAHLTKPLAAPSPRPAQPPPAEKAVQAPRALTARPPPVGQPAPPRRVPPVAPPPAAAPATPGLDPELVADLLSTGLSLAEVHATLGLPPPPSTGAAGTTSDGATERGSGRSSRKGR